MTVSLEDTDRVARAGSRQRPTTSGPGDARPHGPQPTDRRGFSLVDLLVAIIVLGVLSAMALKIADAKRAAYLTVMKSDLRNLVLAQQNEYENNGRYANAVAQLDFDPSPDVNLVVVGGDDGWSARAQHQIRTDFRCAIFIRDANPIFTPAEVEGVIECEPKKGGGQGQGGGQGKGKGK